MQTVRIGASRFVETLLQLLTEMGKPVKERMPMQMQFGKSTCPISVISRAIEAGEKTIEHDQLSMELPSLADVAAVCEQILELQKNPFAQFQQLLGLNITEPRFLTLKDLQVGFHKLPDQEQTIGLELLRKALGNELFIDWLSTVLLNVSCSGWQQGVSGKVDPSIERDLKEKRAAAIQLGQQLLALTEFANMNPEQRLEALAAMEKAEVGKGAQPITIAAVTMIEAMLSAIGKGAERACRDAKRGAQIELKSAEMILAENIVCSLETVSAAIRRKEVVLIIGDHQIQLPTLVELEASYGQVPEIARKESPFIELFTAAGLLLDEMRNPAKLFEILPWLKLQEPERRIWARKIIARSVAMALFERWLSESLLDLRYPGWNNKLNDSAIGTAQITIGASWLAEEETRMQSNFKQAAIQSKNRLLILHMDIQDLPDIPLPIAVTKEPFLPVESTSESRRKAQRRLQITVGAVINPGDGRLDAETDAYFMSIGCILRLEAQVGSNRMFYVAYICPTPWGQRVAVLHCNSPETAIYLFLVDEAAQTAEPGDVTAGNWLKDATTRTKDELRHAKPDERGSFLGVVHHRGPWKERLPKFLAGRLRLRSTGVRLKRPNPS